MSNQSGIKATRNDNDNGRNLHPYIEHICSWSLRNITCKENTIKKLLRPWQTRTHCCGHIVANTNVSLFACTRNMCWRQKFCVWDTKNVSDFVQKHFVSTTNVSQFVQPKKHHGQQCVHNNVSSFTRAFNLGIQNTLKATAILCPQQMFPSLRSPRNIMGNNVSATMCPRLPGP